MKCPGCGNQILSLSRSCQRCGYDYGEVLYDKFAFYFALKDELDKLTKLQNSLYAGMANVSVKIKKYEAVLRRDLASVAVSANENSAEKTKKKQDR